jgi:hypothetical protein
VSFLKKGKSLGLIASLAVAGVLGVGASDSYAFGETGFSKSINGYKVTGTTSLTRAYQDGIYFWTVKSSSQENYVTGTLSVSSYLYNAATGTTVAQSPLRRDSDTSPRNGQVSSSVSYRAPGSADYSARSYHSGTSGGDRVSGYSYDSYPG